MTATLNPARRAAEQVGPSVVRVGRHGGRGGGLVIEPGAVVTNAHNLRGPEITVTFADGRREVGTVAGHDVDGDLAVIRVDTGDAPAVEWSGTADLGDPVYAVGQTVDGALRVTAGAVSSTGRAFRGPRGRRITGSLEHTAPLARGSSGSPVVDADGRVVGLNTHRLGEGLYLALPADEALRERLASLSAGEVRTPRRLGVGLAPAHVARKLRRSVGLEERDGLLVRLVEDAGPAATAGVREGDLLVRAGDRELTTVDDLHDALDDLDGGTALVLTVVRGSEELEVRVAFDAVPAEEEGTA